MNPVVLVADRSEEWRALLMQYVAIEWPHAIVEECGDAIMTNPADLKRFDLMLIGAASGESLDVGWLAALRLRPDAPVPIVFADGEPAADDALVGAGVARQNKQRLTKEGIGAMLRAALQQRSARMSTSAAAQGKGASGQQAAPRPGIKGYRVLRKLGEGGMSQIFLAENTRTGQVGALKVLTVTSGEITDLKLFIKEYDIISKLNSPYIVRIYDHGVADDHIFIAMEYLPGGNLKDRMSLGVGPNEALDILVQLGRALDIVHCVGVVHRDVKPHNVMFRDPRALVLVDFGVSRVSQQTSVIRAGQIVGTPTYISPDAILGHAVDGRSDLYSTGVMLFEMLTGKPPYTGNSVGELLLKHTRDDVPRLPSRFAPYQELTERLLAKSPDERFASAAEMLSYVESRFGKAA
jgi:eukaryotic-like serine/threonine-protein kinase